MKNYYRTRFFRTENPSYRREGGFFNIKLIIDLENIVRGVSIDWESTNVSKLLEIGRNNYGEEKIIERLTLIGIIIRDYRWQTESKIIQLNTGLIMTTIILDKKWYYENISIENKMDADIIF
jgi:hypothetical protein